MQSLAKRVSLVTDSPDCYVSQENPSEIDKGCATSSSSTSTRPSRRGEYTRYLPPSRPIRPLSGTKITGWLPLPELTEALDALKALPRTRVMAREMLERLYSKAFVDELAAGVDYVAVNPEDGGKTHVRDEVDAALMLYNLFIIGPGMIREAQAQGGSWDLEQFITPEESAWFSYLPMPRTSTRRGRVLPARAPPTPWPSPCLTASSTRYRPRWWKRRASMSPSCASPMRETLIPLAALMKLEGSRQSAQPGVLMSQENNEWRGGWVSPYAANIQWDVYRNEAGRVLVKMLYNEKELAFKAGCAPLRWAASSMTSASSNAVTTISS